MSVVEYRFLVRAGTAAAVAALNEVPLERELIFETDTLRFKIGDGITPYTELPYVPSGQGGSVASVNGQTGAVSLGIANLNDVDVGAIADGDVLAWDAVTSAFLPQPAGAGGIDEIVPGTNVTVDNTDPSRPVVSATGTGAPGPQGPPGPRGGGLLTDTKALLHFDGPNGSVAFPDATGSRSWGYTGLGAFISTAQSRFGGSSLRLQASSFIYTPHSPDLSMVYDFTAEAWIRRDTASRNTIFSKGAATAGTWYFAAIADGTAQLVFGTGSYVVVASAPGAIPVGTWVHVAVVKQLSTARIYVNGVQVASGTITGTVTDQGTQFEIGRETSGAADRYFIGYMDEVRYSNSAKYTANFTPPSAPFALPAGPALPWFTRVGLPNPAGNEYVMVYVTDLTGGAEPCVSDGFNWRRLSDRSVAS